MDRCFGRRHAPMRAASGNRSAGGYAAAGVDLPRTAKEGPGTMNDPDREWSLGELDEMFSAVAQELLAERKFATDEEAQAALGDLATQVVSGATEIMLRTLRRTK